MTEQPLSTELSDIVDFIRQTLPFSTLPEAVLVDTVRHLQVGYYRKGQVFDEKTPEQGLRIVRSGAVELRSQDGELLDQLAEGENFALSGLLKEEPGIRAVLMEDSLIYLLPQDAYEKLRSQHRDFDRFFHGQRSRRLFRATRRMISDDAMIRPVHTMMISDLLTIDPEACTEDLARMMCDRRVSSALVIEDGQLIGIVTDRDLRTRVLAEGLDGRAQVRNVMTPDPVTLDEKATIFDATLLMTRHGLHHLPIVKAGQATGILTTTDLIAARQNDPVYIVHRLTRQQTLVGMQEILKDVPRFLVQWSDNGVPADQVSHILTAISDAATIRLMELALEELGPAPVPFCWVGFGSQARGEQLLNADQDNALVISDKASEKDMAWFETLAHRVSDGLDACGYVYCPGDVMASNIAWRKTLTQWREAVDRWTRMFNPQHVMEISIAFDIRGIYGDMTLASEVQKHMLERTQNNSIFQAALADNVLDDRAPIGIFRRFVVERNGEHKDTLNLKKRGILPIIEMVRLYSLAAGSRSVNTLDRLRDLVDSGRMSRHDSRNLQDALRFLMQVRLQIQADQIRAGEPLSNYCNPRSLPKLAKEQLRDAFKLVDDAQRAIRMRYRQGMR